MSVILYLLLILLVVCVYLLPVLIACSRNHPQTAPIAIINMFFGWTLIVWVGCLAWSVSGFQRPYEPRRIRG